MGSWRPRGTFTADRIDIHWSQTRADNRLPHVVGVQDDQHVLTGRHVRPGVRTTVGSPNTGVGQFTQQVRRILELSGDVRTDEVLDLVLGSQHRAMLIIIQLVAVNCIDYWCLMVATCHSLQAEG
jgi:hypothetical protein